MSDSNSGTDVVWHKAAELDELPEGRVKSVTCGLETICLTHHQGKYAALDNRCPHQGGPLGEGSIENGYLRCPWHGWDYEPLTGKPPGGYDDGVATYPIDIREDGVYVAIETASPHVRTTTDVMAETLVNWGVDSVFGMVGHSNLGMADAFRRQQQRGKLRYIGIRHEGAAAFAASAYGKLTGKPAVCFAIAGPGATNLLTGLWDANVDTAPVIAITGQVPSQLLGRGAFQEIDLVKAYGQVAVWSTQVSAKSDFAELTTIACKSATVESGVAHIVLPDEMQTQPDASEASGPKGRIGPIGISPPAESLDEAVELLAKAKRPVIVVGHGARFDMDAITELAGQLTCPVLTTFKGKGLISDTHPSGCGVLGRSGTPVASWFMNESDVLLVLGSSFSNHTGITDKKPTIQVDMNRMRLGRFHAVDVPVWGEIGTTVGLLRERLSSGAAAVDQRPEIAERWQIWRAEKQRRLAETSDEGISSSVIFEALTRAVPANAIMPVDVGNNTYSFGRYFECENQSVLMSGYAGSIGFGLPAALGAWAATQGDDPRFKGRPVVSLSGDGGLGQYLAEVTTAVKYKMNITHVLVNNGELGKISKEQRSGNWHVWQTALTNPNFAEYATNCGALGIRVTSADELDAALSKAIAHDGPSLVEIIADAALI